MTINKDEIIIEQVEKSITLLSKKCHSDDPILNYIKLYLNIIKNDQKLK